MAERTPQQRSIGVVCGLALIAYGVVGAIYQYVSDVTSAYTAGDALFLALMHVVLFGVGGGLVIAWATDYRPQSILSRNDDGDSGGRP